MAIHFIGSCDHKLVPVGKKFGTGTALRCEKCKMEMLDCPENRARFEVKDEKVSNDTKD